MEKILERYGVRTATVLTMLACCTGSITVTLVSLLVFGFPSHSPIWTFAISVALVTPLIVGTPCIYWLFNYSQRLRESEKSLSFAAATDALTGLYNRQYFLTEAYEHTRRANRERCPLSILMLDLDHFKRINDCYGHPVGDEALCKASHLIRSFMRKEDICARYGGEEFICLLPCTDIHGARRVAERIREGFASIELEDTDCTLSASIGIACMAGTGDLMSMIKQADEALYKAKDHGRNRVEANLPPSSKPEPQTCPAGSSLLN